MQVTRADLCDRYSILKLKQERLPRDERVSRELKAYKAALLGLQMHAYCDRLYDVNSDIWHLESDIRQGKLLNPTTDAEYAEIGRRAVAIRELNAQRIAIKNEIAETFGEFVEVKVDHASEAPC
jgi:hypothetical protein